METIIISSDKIKIMLSGDEMEKLCPPEILPEKGIGNMENTEYIKTEAAIWAILDTVSESAGFDTERDSFYVQIYPSKCGGCEMFITRILIPSDKLYSKGAVKRENRNATQDEEAAYGMKYIYGNEKDVLALSKEKGAVPRQRRPAGTFIYRFESFETLLNVCREISLSANQSRLASHPEEVGVSEAYYDDSDGSCYLILENDSFQAPEFGGERRAKKERCYIAEHCRSICQNAVETLGKYAV